MRASSSPGTHGVGEEGPLPVHRTSCDGMGAVVADVAVACEAACSHLCRQGSRDTNVPAPPVGNRYRGTFSSEHSPGAGDHDPSGLGLEQCFLEFQGMPRSIEASCCVFPNQPFELS